MITMYNFIHIVLNNTSDNTKKPWYFFDTIAFS